MAHVPDSATIRGQVEDPLRQKMLHPDKSDSFFIHFKFHLSHCFAGFNVWKDLLWGLLLAIGTQGLQIYWELMPETAHTVKLVLSYVIPAISIITVHALWKVICALRRACRIPRFNDYAKVVLFVGCGTCIWTMLLWREVYNSSPHIKLYTGGWVGSPPMYLYRIGDASNYSDYSSIPDLNGFHGLLAYISFERINADNSGVPSKCTNWRLIAKLPDGEKIIGVPMYGDSMWNDKKSNVEVLSASASLFAQMRIKLKPGPVVSGWAEFYFKDIRKETLRQIGTDLKIACDDDAGREVSTHQKVEAPEAIPRLPFSR